MTNVDFEGFNDWSDEELIEAINTINTILESRNKAINTINTILNKSRKKEKDFERFKKG